MRPQIITLTGSGAGATQSDPVRLNWRAHPTSFGFSTDGSTTAFTAQYTVTPPNGYASATDWGNGATWYDTAIAAATAAADAGITVPIQGARLIADANGTDTGTLIVTQAREL